MPLSDFKPTAIELAQALMKGLVDQTLDPKPVALLQQGVHLLGTTKGLSGAEKKQLLLTAVKMIAAGPDGMYRYRFVKTFAVAVKPG